MLGTKNVVNETTVSKKISVVDEENITKEIEKILRRSGYKKLIQPRLPGECKAAYVKGTRIIVMSDTPEADDMQIQSIHTWHRVELSMARGRAKEKKKLKDNEVI